MDNNVHYREEDTGNQCCGVCFKFEYEDLQQVSNLKFYSVGETILIMTYVKDGNLYFSISFNCGQSFLKPRKVMEIGGTVKDIQISAKDKQFVVALMINDEITKKDIKKAISGTIDQQNYTFDCKECVKQEVKGKLINIAVGFRPWYNPSSKTIEGEESVDFNYYFDDNGEICLECNGHMCLVT